MDSRSRGWVWRLTLVAAFSSGMDGAGAAEGQRARPAWGGYEYNNVDLPERTVFPSDRFTFCRIRYTSFGEHPKYNQRGRWMIDFPESDEHFSWRLSELTTIQVAKDDHGNFDHAVVTLTDPALYNYPFVYLIEPGALVFSDEEAVALRDYLLRGGFLMVDDFWGEAEWNNWEAEFSRVFDPAEYRMDELDLSHPIFNCVFELKAKPQVPSAYFWMRSGGHTSERGAESAEPHYKGVYDKRGRLMVVVCHNTDLGDGWEREAENQAYFEEMSAKHAYPMGINIVVYALTH